MRGCQPVPVAVLIFAFTAGASGSAQTIDSHGISSGGVRIDATGVHSRTVHVERTGVHPNARGAGTVIDGNRAHRSIDCHGGALTINGNANVMTASNCSALTVPGNDNVLQIAFAGSGSLTIVGNRNRVSYSAPRGVMVALSNMGSGGVVSRR